MVGLASVLVFGIAAQWLAWRLRLPSILILLLVGFAVGPLTSFLDPDELMGESLLPFVSLAVAVILLEGGMSLRFRDLKGAGGAVRKLILFGSPLTWLFTAFACYRILELDLQLSLLIGGILVVTGPTVIIPLLRHVRPQGSVASVVRWEGIVSDPIGAILAVLVFQAMQYAGDGAMSTVLFGLLRATFVGSLAGAIGAGVLVLLMRKNLVPDFLHTSMTLSIGIACFVASNAVQHESGLLAVTLMGLLLANQHIVPIEHIVEFKENLRVLLISCLFILLAARVPIEELTRFDGRTWTFVVVLILVVRPASVFLSMLGSGLSWRERTFVAWMAPRGIVAAAVASVFALELGAAGYPGADRVLSVVFAVIVATVTVYGLTAGPLARWLGLSKGEPEGILIVGAHDWARALAIQVQAAGAHVMLVDTIHRDVQAARIDGLEAYYGSVLSEDFESHAPIDQIGHLLCLTPNDEVNSLACLHFAPIVGRAHTHQLVPEVVSEKEESIPPHLRGRILFARDLHFWRLNARFGTGSVFKRTSLGEEFDYDDFLTTYDRPDAPAIPLLLLKENGRLRVFTDTERPEGSSGDVLVSLVRPPEETPAEVPRDDPGDPPQP